MAIQQKFAAMQQVTLRDGSTVTLAPLWADEPDALPTPAAARAQLTAILEQLQQSANDDTAARLALLDTILASDTFAAPVSLWQRLWNWLRSWWPALPEQESNPNAGWVSLGATWIGYLVIGIGALLLVYLLSLWLQNLLGSLLGDEHQGRRLTPDGELLNAGEARQQAQQLARSGSFREAVRRLYLAALLTLDERNLLHYDRSNTNREVLATVRNRPALHARLRPVVETFDDVWYGIHEPDQATFERYQRAVDALAADLTEEERR
jgi:hypothetical protein